MRTSSSVIRTVNEGVEWLSENLIQGQRCLPAGPDVEGMARLCARIPTLSRRPVSRRTATEERFLIAVDRFDSPSYPRRNCSTVTGRVTGRAGRSPGDVRREEDNPWWTGTRSSSSP
jgi:hypothetical protein